MDAQLAQLTAKRTQTLFWATVFVIGSDLLCNFLKLTSVYIMHLLLCCAVNRFGI